MDPRWLRLGRFPAVRQVPQRTGRVEKDLVLFSSWGGRYSDNPRAISEAIHRRGLPLRQCWVLEQDREGPPWADSTLPWSRRHLELLGRAGFIVTNNTLPGFFRKRAGTTVIQTWHGTPLKRIGFDVPDDRRSRNDHLAREVGYWDYLISPNPPSTEWLRSAFRFDGPVLETGYPRNDVLSTDTVASERARLRRSLGLDDGARVVLYAPTFREWGTFDVRLDLAKLADALGPDGHVLERRHHLSGQAGIEHDHPRVHNVSTQPDDPRELFLVADALVTDYSSVMFDFAVTGRPIVFFAWDLAHYRDERRGFYFDFEQEAPGPILQSSDEVVDALRDLDTLGAQWKDRYATFQQKFCSLEDGGAADRVIDRIFAASDASGA